MIRLIQRVIQLKYFIVHPNSFLTIGVKIGKHKAAIEKRLSTSRIHLTEKI